MTGVVGGEAVGPDSGFTVGPNTETGAFSFPLPASADGVAPNGEVFGFTGSFVSVSPVFNNSPNDFFGPENALNPLGAPLKAPNPPVTGAFAGVGDDGAAAANADLNPPSGEGDPNAGAPVGAGDPDGVADGFEKTETGGGVLVSAALKKAEEVGVVSLPNAPNPVAGLNAEGVVTKFPKAPVLEGVLFGPKGEGRGGLSSSETNEGLGRGDVSGDDEGELGMATGVLGVESGLAEKRLSRDVGWVPNAEPRLEDAPPPKAEPPPKADPPPNGDAGAPPASKGDFGLSGVLAEKAEADGVLVFCFAAVPNVVAEPANAPNPPEEGVDAGVAGDTPACFSAPPNVVGAADAKAPNPPAVGVVVAGTTGFPNDDWPKADWPKAGLPNDD